MRRYLARGILALVAATIGVVPVSAAAHAATPSVVISEVTPWGSGSSSYASDWFELTNSDTAAVDITGWRMDDNSDSFSLSVPLSGVTTMAAGQSVVFIELTGSETAAGTEAAFENAWFAGTMPAGFTIGTYSGSGVGLSTSGDAVNIFDASGDAEAGVSFGVSTTNQTFDNAAGAGGAISTLSTPGVDGAFVAGDGVEIGSPGTATVNAGSGGGTTTTTTVATTTTTLPGGATFQTWPGSPDIQVVDGYDFQGNLSGLDYEGSGSAAPGVLWGIRNGPSSLFRIVFDGSAWVPDPTDGWGNGKALRYPDGTGDPDAEGVTFVGDSSAGGMYVSTERDNDNGGVSRKSILRYDPSASGTTLTATNEWNLTGDLPVTGPNLGLEAITWIDDSYLVAQNFFDEAKGHTYNPADYPDHGAGLFFVGLEGNGQIYAYALDQGDSGFSQVATFPSGFPAIMELQFDRDLKDLWAVCDNGCEGRTTVERIDPTTGKFGIALAFERPAAMPNLNNEGFAIAPAAYCIDGFKPVYWADDSDDQGHSIRSGTLPCTAIVATVPPEVPEFPTPVLPVGLAVAIGGGAWVVALRRRQRR